MKSRSRQMSKAIRGILGLLVCCVLITSCNLILSPPTFVTCIADSDCDKGQVCSPAHTCARANAQPCDTGMNGGECASGFCSTDGVCCAEACSGPCRSCPGGEHCSALTVGAKGACAESQACSASYTCARANAQPCDTGMNGGECASGFCSGDGVCCAEACSGPCRSCPGGEHCSAVSVGAKGACLERHVCNAAGRCYCPKLSFPGGWTPPVYDTGKKPESVVALDLNSDGKPDLAVANYNGDAMNQDGSVSVLLGNGDGTFQPQATYATGNFPKSVVAMDLNSDGKPDLAVANYTGDAMKQDGSVSVLLGNGDGTFQPQVSYPTGKNPSSVVAMDLNSDGKPDLAVANTEGDAMNQDGSVSVLFGNGNGTFQPQVTYPTGKKPWSVVAMDLNGDGKPDLAVANHGRYGVNPDGSVSVLLGKGDGTFQPHVDYRTGKYSVSVAAMDLNGDGKPDLAVANTLGDMTNPFGSVSVLLGNGDGTFQTQVAYSLEGALEVAGIDLNGDGKPDLAVTAPYSVSVLLGKGDGTFQPQVIYSTGAGTFSSVTALDLNGNGKPDLAVTNESGDSVSVLLNDGNGVFTPTTKATSSYSTGQYPDSVAALDLNGDGKPDLAVANAGDLMNPGVSVSVLLGKGDGTFQPQVAYPAGISPQSVVAMDLNGDGKPDLAVTNLNGDDMNLHGSVSVLLGKGDGTFQPQVTYLTGKNPWSVAAMDLNGDGKPDLAVANYGIYAMNPDGSVSVLLGKGDGTFQPQVAYRTGQYSRSVVAMDLNGDGKPDLTVANEGGDAMNPGGSVSVLLGMGDGTFQPQVTYASGDGARSVVATDLNDDGKPDLAVASFSAVSVLLNKGDGTFQPQMAYPTVNGSSSVTATDLNDDGKPDLAVANLYHNSVTVLLNNGNGTFQPQMTYAAGSGPVSIVALDLNGDGQPDLVTANATDNTVTVLLNTCLP